MTKGVVGSLEVEPRFLARVNAATFAHADAEMAKMVRCARGPHGMFHVFTRHGYELVFRG